MRPNTILVYIFLLSVASDSSLDAQVPIISSDLTISIGFLFAPCFLSQIARTYFSYAVPKGFLQILAAEFVAMFEMCAICYEMGIVTQFHGRGAYFIGATTISFWRSFYWGTVSGTPWSYALDWWTGKFEGGVSVVWITLAQFLGGLSVYQYYIKFVWSFGALEAHAGRYEEGLSCESDVRVPTVFAALTEGAAMFVCGIVGYVMPTLANATISNAVNSVVGTLMVISALGISGGYLNPVLASILQYGCSGSTFKQQFLVYWLPHLIGTFSAYYAWNFIQQHLQFSREAKAQKKPKGE